MLTCAANSQHIMKYMYKRNKQNVQVGSYTIENWNSAAELTAQGVYIVYTFALQHTVLQGNEFHSDPLVHNLCCA